MRAVHIPERIAAEIERKGVERSGPARLLAAEMRSTGVDERG